MTKASIGVLLLLFTPLTFAEPGAIAAAAKAVTAEANGLTQAQIQDAIGEFQAARTAQTQNEILAIEARATGRRGGGADEGAAEEYGPSSNHSGESFVEPRRSDAVGADLPAALVTSDPPVESNIELTRQALEQEAAKGNIAKDAVEPLLAKLGPVLEKIADRIEEAGGDPEKIEEIIQRTPELTLRRSEDGNALQVIAQVTSNGGDGVNGASETKLGAKNSGPAATLGVTKETGGSTGGSTSIVYLGKKSTAVAMEKLPGMKDSPAKEKTKRPLAVGATGTPWVAPIPGAAASGGVAGLGTGAVASGGKLPAVPRTKSGIQALISSILKRGTETKESREPASVEETAGFSLLKFPKLSDSSALWDLPRQIWNQKSVFSVQSQLGRKLPFWLDLMLVLSAFAVSVTMLWLVWRRRYFMKRVVVVRDDSRD